MSKIPNQQKSRFIVSYRLKPSQPFSGLQAKISTGDGYELDFRDDMVWIGFDATSDEWLHSLDIGRQALRTLLAILTIQTEYAFDLEPIQWIEDKPRDEVGTANYVLGRLGPDLTVQKEAPTIRTEHFHKGEIYVHLASRNAYYRYALLDYSLALSFVQESIIFCARSVEWIEKYFKVLKESLPKQKQHTRTLMRNELSLLDKYLTQFSTIANNTVIARHGGDPNKVRPPKIEEIRFCIFFSRVVIDRFSSYLWYSLSNSLPSRWKYPRDEKSPSELFKAKNSSLTKSLEQILSGKLS